MQHIFTLRAKLLVLYFFTNWSPFCKLVDTLLPDMLRKQNLRSTTVLMNKEPVDRLEAKFPVELMRRLKELQVYVEIPPHVAHEDQIAGAHQ